MSAFQTKANYGDWGRPTGRSYELRSLSQALYDGQAVGQNLCDVGAHGWAPTQMTTTKTIHFTGIR